MAFTFKESSSYLFNKDDQEYIFNKRRLSNSSVVQLNLKNQYVYIYWKLYNTHLEIQLAPTLTDYITYKINLPKNMRDNIQFKEDENDSLVYMFLLSNDGIIFKYTINIKSREINLQNLYIKSIQKQQVQLFKIIDQDNFIITTTLNEIITIRKLKDDSIIEKKQNLNSSILRNFSKFITNNMSTDVLQDLSYIKYNNKIYIIVLFNNILYVLNENLKFIFNKELMKPTVSTSKKYISIYDLYTDDNNEYTSFNLCILLGNEFHIFKMIIDQNENVNLNADDILLPIIEAVSINEKKKVFINTFQITYINNHFVLWVEQKDTFDKSIIKYLYLGENNKLSSNFKSYCPEIWLPLITNNIIENSDSIISSKKSVSENSIEFNSKIKETIINIDNTKGLSNSLSTLSFSNFSLISDINDIPSMPSYCNNDNEEDEQDSIELIKEYYLNYIFNINRFSLSILYYALMKYSEESSIATYIDQTELKHIGLKYIKKCIVNCINEKISSNAINYSDKATVEKEYKKFLYYCVIEYENENKFVSFLQYSQENIGKINIPMFILIKKAYITTINLCDTSEIFYNALINKHSIMELQYLFSITDLNKKNLYHNVSSSMSLFLSAVDQLYKNNSSFEKFGINNSSRNLKNSTLNIQQFTRDVIVGICKSSIQLESLVENIYWDYLEGNENFLRKIRKLKDIKGCIEYIFSILNDQDEKTIPLENAIQNELRNNDGRISKSYITYLAQLISVNVKEVINARYHLCFHLFIVLIALYVMSKKNSFNKNTIETQRMKMFNSDIGHFEYLNSIYRCKSYLHALIILKWASEYSNENDLDLSGDEKVKELNILKNLSLGNTSKNSIKREVNNNDIEMDNEKITYILSYFNINKINMDINIDKAVLSHTNDSLLFRLIYSSILSLVKYSEEEKNENSEEKTLSNISDSLALTNYFSLYPSDLVKQSISFLDIIYDYSHRYLDTLNLSWYSKEYIFNSPLISFIIQLIQHSTKSIHYLRELLPSMNSSCIFLLQGIISLISNDIESSEDYFEKAGSAFVSKTVDSSIYTFLPLTIENSFQYYQYIMHLYQNIKPLYEPIEKFAKLSLLHMKEDKSKDDLMFVLFNCHLNTLNFEEAFLVVQNIMDPERKKQLLKEFVIKICENDQTLLFKFNFSGCKEDIENILNNQIKESTNLLSTPNYNKILYSYLIYNSSYRKAALYMYKYAQRLYKCCKTGNLENSFKTLLVEQSKALLIALNALSLVDKKNQYIIIDHEAKSDGIVRNVNISLLDIKKEYYLSLSKLELSKNHKESEISILSLDPVDAVTLYISLGKYDTAISFSLLYGFDLSIIFQNLLLQYVKSSYMIVNSNSNYITDYFEKILNGKEGMNKTKDDDKREKKVSPTINLPKQLFIRDGSSNNVTIYNYKKAIATQEGIKQKDENNILLNRGEASQGRKASVMNNTVDFHELLKKFLDLHDSTDNYYRYHKVVIEKFLETCVTSEVPEWLIEPFMNHFPEDLIRIYIKYNRIKEAALFTIKLINNMDVTKRNEKWFPYTVIDQLICIMEERSEKDFEDKKIFTEYINLIKKSIQVK
ncbi:hypothetical protein BCR36DRAFT_326516, partial [Piromyces finnis]